MKREIDELKGNLLLLSILSKTVELSNKKYNKRIKLLDKKGASPFDSSKDLDLVELIVLSNDFKKKLICYHNLLNNIDSCESVLADVKKGIKVTGKEFIGKLDVFISKLLDNVSLNEEVEKLSLQKEDKKSDTYNDKISESEKLSVKKDVVEKKNCDDTDLVYACVCFEISIKNLTVNL